MKAYKVIQRIPATATYVFEVSAESKEDAIKIISEMKKDDIDNHLIDQDYWIELNTDALADTIIEEMKIQ